jgi:hypothetical protein
MPFDDADLSANTRAFMMLMGLDKRAFKRKGGHCLVGAMDRVEGIRFRDMENILGFLAAAIEKDAGDVVPNFCTVSRYNDAKGRTLDDILAVIVKARAIAMVEGGGGAGGI